MTASADLQLDIQYATEATDLPAEGDLHRWVVAALAAGGLADSRPLELALRLVDEAEGAELNARYRGGTGPTNVLSFPAELPPGLPLLCLGDLVLCVPLVTREARAQGKPVDAHWAHLVVHGVLHLLGHDHEEETAAEHMEQLEIQVLAGLGVANPYVPVPAQAGGRMEDSTQNHG